jgi:hypothetical protein
MLDAMAVAIFISVFRGEGRSGVRDGERPTMPAGLPATSYRTRMFSRLPIFSTEHSFGVTTHIRQTNCLSWQANFGTDGANMTNRYFAQTVKRNVTLSL